MSNTQVRPMFIVTDGVKIGKGGVITVNSCITKDAEPYSIYGGVPGRKIGSRK